MKGDLKKKITEFLKSNYPESIVYDMFDLEVLEWVEDDWEDHFETESDWYKELGQGEAETVIENRLTKEVRNAFGNEAIIDIVEILESLYCVINWR